MNSENIKKVTNQAIEIFDGIERHVADEAWRSQIHNFLKTDSGYREIDLCPALASINGCICLIQER